MRAGVQRLGRHYFSSAGPNSRQLIVLEQSLYKEPPSVVFNRYIAALNTLGDVPLPIHRAVLRKCTPSAQDLRALSNSQILHHQERHLPKYEGRLQTVIRNIRAQGATSTSDYNFVLEQFAATGNYEASMRVLREMSASCKPTSQTYSLCMQALARALTLPSPRGKPKDPKRSHAQSQEYRLQLLKAAKLNLRNLMDHMRVKGVAWTPAILDLLLRIMKEISDRAGFEEMLKTGYGIDMSYPDQVPFDGGEGLYPLSTDALNVILDFYAQERDISKLIQAFEVLTNPLPQSVIHHSHSNSFDGEDDEDFGVPSENTSKWTPPSASPNTTSFRIILRALKKENLPALARHYLLHAMELSYSSFKKTRYLLLTTPHQYLPTPSSSSTIIPAPSVSVTKDMFSAVLASGRKRLESWAKNKLKKEVRRKKEEYEWFVGWWQGLKHQSLSFPDSTPPSSTSSFVPMNPYKHRLTIGQDIPQYSRGYVSSSLPKKPFSPSLHLRILRRDLKDLVEMLERLSALSARSRTVVEVEEVTAPTEEGGEKVGVVEEAPVTQRGRRRSAYMGPGRRIGKVWEMPPLYSGHGIRSQKRVPVKETSRMKGFMKKMGVSGREEQAHVKSKRRGAGRLYAVGST